ncbi:MAG TPA: exodeoxyribonuclease VII large subunit [Acidimicrobiia bacterium]|nr:exodeoxyribonuclease VII large subunit [Acidimicrobiia bacterium]
MNTSLELDLGPEPDPTLTVGEIHSAVRRLLAPRFGRRVWVRGTVRDLKENPRSGHLFLTLCDPGRGRRGRDATLRAVCWSTTWPRVRRRLQRAGVALTEGCEVRVAARVDVWDGGQLALTVEDVDVDALVGRLALARAELCTALRAEGLWDANRALELSPLPLHVGLVAAPGTQGEADFCGVLASSGFSFHVEVAAATVQGPQASVSIAGAVRALSTAHARGAALDVVVLVRGGGSQADLAAFDDERVARAVATCPVPVWAGIGHTDDRTVTDELAHRCFATPTAAAHGLVHEVRAAAAAVTDRAQRVTASVRDRLAAAGHGVHLHEERAHVAARRALRTEATRAAHEALRVEHAATSTLIRASARVDAYASEARARSVAALRVALAELDRRHAVLDGADPSRILRRGFSLTRRADGTLVRDAATLQPGDELVTRLSQGAVRSRVEQSAR